MVGLTRLTILVLLLGTSAVLHAAPTWSKAHCFFGRWDIRTANRAVTVNSGSYIRARFSGASLSAFFDVSLNQPAFNPAYEKPTGKGSLPTIAWQIDEGKWQEAEIATTVKLAEGLPAGRHSVMLMVRGLDEHQNRWTVPLVASVTFTGFGLEKSGKLEKPLPQWVKPALSIEFLGDSITEGVVVNEGRAGVVAGIPFTWPWLSDARLSYVGQTAMALGAEWRQVGFGATGLMLAGSGGVPGALDSFNLFYAGCPRDTWQPNVVVVNQGTNEPSIPSKEYQLLYARYLSMLRKAYPKAKIVALRPFNGAQEASIKAAVDVCHGDGDSKVYFVDTAGWYSGNLHPNIEGSAAIAEKLSKALQSEVLTTKTGTPAK
ncbi:MAG: GDSL-type esterase/lipase family protein [Armatimonadetes bacterium]|nr:GDSL-type esterase/lipase family protein [Armatimonadota bacterium]